MKPVVFGMHASLVLAVVAVAALLAGLFLFWTPWVGGLLLYLVPLAASEDSAAPASNAAP